MERQLDSDRSFAEHRMGRRDPGATGVVAADQALHTAGRQQPTALQHKRLAVAHLLRQMAEPTIGEQPQPLQLGSAQLQPAVALDGFGPVGTDRGRLAYPAAEQLVGTGGGALRCGAAGTELTDQHQLLKAAGLAVQQHKAVAAVVPDEAELTAERCLWGNLQRALVERSRREEHHLPAQAAVVLLHGVAGFACPICWPTTDRHRRSRRPAPQPKAHQPVVIVTGQREHRRAARAQDAIGGHGGEAAPPFAEVAQKVLPLAGHQS